MQIRRRKKATGVVDEGLEGMFGHVIFTPCCHVAIHTGDWYDYDNTNDQLNYIPPADNVRTVAASVM